MSRALIEEWQQANQRHLVASLNLLRASIAQRLDPEAGDGIGEAAEALASARAAMPAPPAIERICAAFDLSPFERDVLLLCAGVEFDGAFGGLCAQLHGDPGRTWPSFGLALELLPEAHWSALLPAAPLRRWRLLELGPGESLVARSLHIDERVLHELAGLPSIDERLRPFVRLLSSGDGIVLPSRQSAAEQVATAIDACDMPLYALIVADDPADAQSVAAAACAQASLRPYLLRADDVPAGAADRESLATLWEREALLAHAALVLDCNDADEPATTRAADLIDQLDGPLFALAQQAPPARRAPARIDVPALTVAERIVLWRDALGPLADQLGEEVEALAMQFQPGETALRSAARLAQVGPQSQAAARLWQTCRAHGRPRLAGLARRIAPAAGWGDLVLPDAQLATLRQVVAHLRARHTVYERWRFAQAGGRGLGVSVLFAGPSGTGKTLAAEVLAATLELDLYKIDLSQTVSKYIGETEKHLRRIFDAAEASGAILLFDEADALFGKRSEVKDSHDRYANIEISYLLQRMEEYHGLAILTTNMRSMLDGAFLRRLRFVVDFPFPNAVERAAIWRKAVPLEAPAKGLDVERLARLSVSGASIRNIALGAALLAADKGDAISMGYMLAAARAELAKLEQPMSAAETAGWGA